jgi:gamma-glutamyltranspeptidase/glutathione hydrolase
MKVLNKHCKFVFFAALLILTQALITQQLSFAASYPKPAFGKKVMISSASPDATKAGLKILKQGGNAFEAAIAVSYVLSVTQSYSSGIGGGGFAMIYNADEDKIYALDFREMAPLKAHRDMYLDENNNIRKGASLHGALAIGVPGQVAGLSYIEEHFGNKFKGKRDVLLADALRLSEKGFPVTPIIKNRTGLTKEHFNSEMKKIFLNDGKVPELGHMIVQKDLAKTLKAIIKNGKSGFYSGKVAELMVKGIQDAGGIISLEDLKEYKVIRRNPVFGSFKGYEIASFPPPSSGGIHFIQILNILEKYPLNKWGHHSDKMLHHFAESMRLAYADRAVYLGDPDFVCVPREGLISKKYAKKLRGKISKTALNSENLLADDPWSFTSKNCKDALIKPKPKKATARNKGLMTAHYKPEGTHTSHFSIVDEKGNAVAITQTVNTLFGSSFMPAGTGIVMNNEMDDFSAKPGVPNYFGLIGGEANAIAPKKRPLSSMTPTLIFRKDKDGKRKLNMLSGTRGGSKIITNTLQSFLNAAVFGMDIQKSLSVPRVHHQWKPDQITYEKGAISEEVMSSLKKRGHKLNEIKEMCDLQSIWVDFNGNKWGGSDTRGEGLAKGF